MTNPQFLGSTSQIILHADLDLNSMKMEGLAVRRIGQGYPVLFVHGWNLSGSVEAFDFEPVFSTKSDYCRIYLDLPGMGNSAAAGVQDLDAILEIVSGYVTKHILPSRFLLVGSSCGAYLVRALAYRYASAVDGILLRVPLIEPLDSKRDVDQFAPAIRNEDLLSSLPDPDRKLLGDIPVQTAEYITKIKHKMETAVLPAIAAADSKQLDVIRKDARRYKLTAPMHSPDDVFTKPVLVITGRQDTVVGYRDAWKLLASYLRATFVTLDRADHGLPVDGRDLFGGLINDWLWRVEESRRLTTRE